MLPFRCYCFLRCFRCTDAYALCSIYCRFLSCFMPLRYYAFATRRFRHFHAFFYATPLLLLPPFTLPMLPCFHYADMMLLICCRQMSLLSPLTPLTLIADYFHCRYYADALFSLMLPPVSLIIFRHAAFHDITLRHAISLRHAATRLFCLYLILIRWMLPLRLF